MTEEPIRVETAMDYGDFKRFSWFNALRRGRGLRPSFIVLIAAFAVCLVTCVLIASVDGLQAFLQRSGATALVVLLFFPCYILMLKLMFRLTYQRSANLLAFTQRFAFTEDLMRVESAGQAVTGTSEARYENFYRVYETKQDFYLYVNKLQAFMLPKHSLTGNAERLITLLKEKMGKNYIVCY